MSSDANKLMGPAELRNIGLFGALSDDVLDPEEWSDGDGSNVDRGVK